MTKEVIKVYFPYLKALADDKEVQCDISGEWKDIEEISFSIGVEHYRIKPKSKYRPFKNQEECWLEMHKHPDFGWGLNNIGEYVNLSRIRNEGIYFNKGDGFDFSKALKGFRFTDGKPFGIMED